MPYTFWLWQFSQFSPMRIFLGIDYIGANPTHDFSEPQSMVSPWLGSHSDQWPPQSSGCVTKWANCLIIANRTISQEDALANNWTNVFLFTLTDSDCSNYDAKCIPRKSLLVLWVLKDVWRRKVCGKICNSCLYPPSSLFGQFSCVENLVAVVEQQSVILQQSRKGQV